MRETVSEQASREKDGNYCDKFASNLSPSPVTWLSGRELAPEPEQWRRVHPLQEARPLRQL